MEALIMITTESSNANALRMAKLLVQNKLAACVSIKQIFSIYKWDDDIGSLCFHKANFFNL